MKLHQVLIFILSVFALLFVAWFFIPAGGIKAGRVSLRFPSYEARLDDLRNGTSGVDVDSVLQAARRSYEMLKESEDSLGFFHEYLASDSARIHLPGDDWSFFDSLFIAMDGADTAGRIVRIMHYGDSQLEMDRISSVLRQELQERFGGSGPGMVPMIQRIPSVSVRQSASGALTRFARVADSLSHWTSTHRYGPMTQSVAVYGNGTFNFRSSDSRYAKERVRTISKVAVLLGHNSKDLRLTLRCDTLKPMTAVLDSAREEVSLVKWDLPVAVAKGSVTISGNAEVYGVLLDGDPGVTVDNVAMRGCSGTVFTDIDPGIMRESFDLLDTRLVILQFGGNAMPGIGSRKAISSYVRHIEDQFGYFREVAPKAKLLFVGPADMCKSAEGYFGTWPLLEDLNDSLRVHCLEAGVAYWDTFSVMGGAGSMRKWVSHNPPLAGPDYIHFTTRGADEIGGALAKSLLLYDDFHRLRMKLSEAVVKEYMDSLSAAAK